MNIIGDDQPDETVVHVVFKRRIGFVVTGWVSLPPGHVLSGVPRVAAMCGLKNEPGSSGSTYCVVPFGATLIEPEKFVFAMLYGLPLMNAAVKSPALVG